MSGGLNSQGYWEAISLEEWISEFHAGARSSNVHSYISQKQQINFPKVYSAAAVRRWGGQIIIIVVL